MRAGLAIRNGLFVLSFAVAGVVQAQVEIRVPYETPNGHIKSRSIEVFKEALERRSNGHYKVSLFPAAQLMSGKDEVPAVARGQVQIAFPAISYITAIEPGFKLFEVPLLFEDYAALERMTSGPVGQELAKRLESKRLLSAGYWYDGFTNLWTRNPVRTLADLKGVKVRVFPSEMLSQITTSLGAVPTAIPGAEVYVALRQGVADGAWTTAPFGAQIKLFDSMKGLTKVNLFVFAYAVVMNPQWYASQSPANQKAIQESLAEGKAFNLREVQASINQAYVTAAQNGMQVIDVDAAELARWRQAVKPVYDGLDADVKALMARIR